MQENEGQVLMFDVGFCSRLIRFSYVAVRASLAIGVQQQTFSVFKPSVNLDLFGKIGK